MKIGREKKTKATKEDDNESQMICFSRGMANDKPHPKSFSLMLLTKSRMFQKTYTLKRKLMQTPKVKAL